MKRIVALFLSLAMVLALASCSSQGGGAADTPDKETTPAGTESSNTEGTTGEVDFSTKVNWIFATQANEGATDAALFENWMEMVTERSGGAITFNYQPGGTLGYGSNLILQAMDGTIQAAVSGIADYTNYSTLTEAFQLPLPHQLLRSGVAGHPAPRVPDPAGRHRRGDGPVYLRRV